MIKKNSLWFVVIVIIGSLFIVACNSAPSDLAAASADSDEHDDAGEHGASEHNMEHMHLDPPAEYANLTNPLNGNKEEVIAAGKIIFETNCATCHGQTGAGDGPGAAAINPKPANLGDANMMNDLSDGYLFWRVSEGGVIEPFNSAMPPWKATLNEEQRWQVISYVRTLSAGQHNDAADEHQAEEHGMDDEHHADDEHHEEAESGEQGGDEHHEEVEEHHEEGENSEHGGDEHHEETVEHHEE